MSCPYLVKGIVARCCVSGKMGLMIDAMEEDTDCFSGNFSDCSFLYNAYPLKKSRNSTPKTFRNSKNNMPAEKHYLSHPAGVR
jgi:hypothetical protein